MMKSNGKKITIYLSAFLLLFSLATYITYPLLWHMGDLVTGFGDEIVIAWIQNWVIHSVLTNPLGIWDINAYFPYHNSYAFSDLVITTSMLAMIPRLLIGQPIVTFNFTVFSSLLLLGFSVFLLSYYLTKNYVASLFSGVLIMCSPAILDKTINVSLMASEWFCFCILSFLVFLKTKRTRFFVLSLIFFILQTMNSLIPGYFILFFFLIYCIYTWCTDRSVLRPLVKKQHILLMIITIALLIPLVLPFYKVSNTFHYVRPFNEAIHFALQPEDFLYPSEHTRLMHVLINFSNMQHYKSVSGELKPGYLGVIFTLLALLTIFYFFLRFKNNKPIFTILMTTAILGLLLSLGPFLHFNRATIHKPFPIPLPYAIFYYILPGFKAFRDSERWGILFILCIAVAISIVLAKMLHKRNTYLRGGLYLVLFVGVIAEVSFPMKFKTMPQVSQFPPIYSWLAAQPPKTPIIMMPMYNWNMAGSPEEMKREYYSTIEFQPMVNGYSGFSPPPWQDLVYSLHDHFPDEKSVAQIKHLGVKYIIVNKTFYDKDAKTKSGGPSGDVVITRLSANTMLSFVKKIGDEYIFVFNK